MVSYSPTRKRFTNELGPCLQLLHRSEQLLPTETKPSLTDINSRQILLHEYEIQKKENPTMMAVIKMTDPSKFPIQKQHPIKGKVYRGLEPLTDRFPKNGLCSLLCPLTLLSSPHRKAYRRSSDGEIPPP